MLFSRNCSNFILFRFRLPVSKVFPVFLLQSDLPRRLTGYGRCFSSACNIRLTTGLDLYSSLCPVPFYIRLVLFDKVLPVRLPKYKFFFGPTVLCYFFSFNRWCDIDLCSRLENCRNFSNHCLVVNTGFPSVAFASRLRTMFRSAMVKFS